MKRYLLIEIINLKISKVALFLLTTLVFFVFCNDAKAQFPGNDNIAGSGKTFSIPTGVTSITASAWGGGGGGGGCSSNNNGGNGGGGGGATTRVINVVAGNTFTYTVGVSGTYGEETDNTPGGNGGASSITYSPLSVLMIANGGTGGNRNSGSLNTPTNSGGGTASGGTTNETGVNGTQGGGIGGHGGASGTVNGIFGRGGIGYNNSSGEDGFSPGGGGAGAERFNGTNQPGGQGGNGQVTFQYIGVTSVSPSTACIGSTITITGFNFASTGTTTVTINGTACTSVTWVSATSITAVVATGTTSGTVVIANDNGTNNGTSITINATVPSASGAITGTASVCQGQAGVAYSVASIANATAYSWSYSGTGVTFTNGTTNSPTVTFSASATSGNFTVMGINSCGSGTVSANFPVTVNPTATTPTIGTITQPTCSTATASVVMSDLPSGPWTLTRSPDNTTTLGSGISATISGVTSGTYTYTVESSGLKADYFNNTSLTGSPVLTRTDASVNFDWGNGSPDSSINSDIFSVRWSGQIKPLYSETYTFYTRSDDGVRLWVNGIQITNNWTDHAAPTYPGLASSTIALTAGVKYNIVLEYYENAGQAVSQLSWSSTSQALQIIPQTQLFPSAGCSSPASSSVVINAQPVSPTITTTATPAVITAVCQSASAQTTTMAYTATTGVPTSYSIVWSGMANQTSTSFAFSSGAGSVTGILIPAGTAAGTYSGTMTVTSFNGCTATKTVTLTVIATPTPTFTTQPGANSCLNTDVTYTTQTGKSNYVWTIPGVLNTDYSITSGGIGSSDSTVTLKWLTTGSKTVSINYSFNGCTAAAATASVVLVNTTYDTTASEAGSYIFCIDGATNTINTSTVNAGQYVVLDVVKGFDYTFYVGNVFSGNENITILDDATNNVINPLISGTSSVTVNNWIATFSGRIKIFLTTGNCANSTTGGSMRLTLNNIGNTQDVQTIAGTNVWRGHIYNWTVDSVPPGGTSPSSPLATNPFDAAQYVGYYDKGTETFSIENFGGNTNCFDVYSNGVVRSKINTQRFAVRYRMKSTRAAGCYLVTVAGDDGVRLYVDNVKVFDEWKEQGTKTYQSVLVYLNGSSDLILDYYENYGGNDVSFDITPFDSGTNTVATPTTSTICNAITPAILNGSNYVYNGSTVNPTLSFQWQSSPDNATWSDVTTGTGQTAEDYTPAAIAGNTTTNITWYRRKLSAVATNTAATACSWYSNAISITTRPVFSTGEIQSTGQSICSSADPSLIGSINPASGGNNSITYQWQRSTDAAFTSPVNIASTNSATYDPPAGLTATTWYRRQAKDGACNTTFTNATNVWMVAVNSKPTAPTVVSKTDVTCETAGSVNLSGLPSGSWTLSPGAITGSGTTYTRTGLAQGTYNFTVSNGCESAASSTVTISDLSTTTWNGSTWSNGTPDATKAMVIAAAYPITTDLTACSLTINSGITVTVPSGITLTITNAVTTNGQLIFENNASLVQTTNATNSGSIQYKRISSLMKNFDFTYWSSPVTGQTALSLSPNTLADKYFRFSGSANNWVFDNGIMNPGVGYIIRVPKPGTWPLPNYEVVTDPYYQPVIFKGVPNNGDYSFAVGQDQYNLVGNPYPSAIDADKFITANSSVIYGALYFWTHNTAIAQSGSLYVYSSNDYATYSMTGGVVTQGGAAVHSGKIAAGQSFFVGNSAAGNFVFNNNMRVGGNNSQFFKFSNTAKTDAIERNRLWLNLTNEGGAFKQLLVGYVTGATNSWDDLYDGASFDGNDYVDFYSVNKTDNLTIQGRALPFDTTDLVPLGYRSTIEGVFEIAIDHSDGLLSSQEVLLEDKKTGVTHNLSKAKYTFTAIKGGENDRFVLKYAKKELNITKEEIVDQMVVAYVKNKNIIISSSVTPIEKVVIYDILGRKLFEKENISSNEFIPENFNSSNQVLILKITLKDETQVTQKVTF